jgi:hypothetical protein
MKVLAAADRDRFQSQSHLVFVRHGMNEWLRAVGEMKVVGVPADPVCCPRVQPQRVESAMVALLADMALNTWKEASSW